MIMEVLKIELEAPICSFRYPHFLVGQQLTFDMPPPSTIFGHVCSAAGRWLEKGDFRFAYKFTITAKGNDLEKQQMLSQTGGKFVHKTQTYPSVTEMNTLPVSREFLFGAKLTLYVDNIQLLEHFENPVFPVVLGRSQDLACYTDVQQVTLEKSSEAYFESTILPFSFRTRTARGVTVLMPNYVEPPPFRKPNFEKYIVLSQRIRTQQAVDDGGLMNIDGDNNDYWTDPQSPEWRGAKRGLIFHSFQ
jgi:CRISPR-associated protein Cas5t